MLPGSRLGYHVHVANLYNKLLEDAKRVGHHKTKKEALMAALSEYIGRRRRLGILSAFGTVDFDPEYDYKAGRRRKRPNEPIPG